jgi:hypothetical protein
MGQKVNTSCPCVDWTYILQQHSRQDTILIALLSVQLSRISTISSHFNSTRGDLCWSTTYVESIYSWWWYIDNRLSIVQLRDPEYTHVQVLANPVYQQRIWNTCLIRRRRWGRESWHQVVRYICLLQQKFCLVDTHDNVLLVQRTL